MYEKGRMGNFWREKWVRLIEKAVYYLKTVEFAQVNSTSAKATNLEIFLMHRPQQFFLSFNSKAEASFLGQVTPALPNS